MSVYTYTGNLNRNDLTSGLVVRKDSQGNPTLIMGIGTYADLTAAEVAIMQRFAILTPGISGVPAIVAGDLGLIQGNGVQGVYRGSGTPEASVLAVTGSIYLDDVGHVWYKQTGVGNTGWSKVDGINTELFYGGTSTPVNGATTQTFTLLNAALVTPLIAAQPYTVEVELTVPLVTMGSTSAIGTLAIQTSDGVTTYADDTIFLGVAFAARPSRLIKRFPGGNPIPALRGVYKTNGQSVGFSGGTYQDMFLRIRTV